jgi:membrane-bound lytic murein transglycosylase D
MNFNKTALILNSIILLLTTGCAKQAINSSSVIEKNPLAEVSPLELVIINRKSPTVQQVFPSPDVTPIKPQTVWERMVSLYKIPEVNNKQVDQEYQWYLNNPEYLHQIQERAEPYVYSILEEIEAKGLPGELALLPVVESAFQAHAFSHKKAAGLWQFIPSTGLDFGLKQNWWYDGRHDIHASTQAATQYLKKLTNYFSGDWLLALASYNAGKSRIERAIQKNRKQNKPTDFWSLQLPRETRNYVPRLLAIAKIFANAEHLNIPLRNIPNQPVFAAVDVGSQLDLAKAAEMAEISVDDFFKYNPGFKRWHTAPNGPHRLLIPIKKVGIFKARLAQLPKNNRVQLLRHKIRSGENLGVIARNHQTSIESIRAINRLSSNRIRAGQLLLIPTAANKHLKHPLASKWHAKERRFYIVKKGDTFWDISRKFSVNSKNLATWNKLNLRSILQPGQKLFVKNI